MENQAPDQQQQQPQADGTDAAAAAAAALPQTMPPLSNDFMSAEAMAGMLQGQPLVADPSMVGLPMPDPQLMMPMMMPDASGIANNVQPPGISAGKKPDTNVRTGLTD